MTAQKCPKCQSLNIHIKKAWIAEGIKGHGTQMTQWVCFNCKKSFRTGEKKP